MAGKALPSHGDDEDGGPHAGINSLVFTKSACVKEILCRPKSAHLFRSQSPHILSIIHLSLKPSTQWNAVMKARKCNPKPILLLSIAEKILVALVFGIRRAPRIIQ